MPKIIYEPSFITSSFSLNSNFTENTSTSDVNVVILVTITLLRADKQCIQCMYTMSFNIDRGVISQFKSIDP